MFHSVFDQFQFDFLSGSLHFIQASDREVAGSQSVGNTGIGAIFLIKSKVNMAQALIL